jgi:2-desacetyl-2-hydroxyethyl bacteriochlorophyllide A dehydrogenase
MNPFSPPAQMSALVWEAACQMTMRSAPLPPVEPDEVLIQVAYAGICGSELSGYLGHNALRVPPLVMGHEFSGKIVALGAQATTHNSQLRVGQAVTVNPMVYCGECEFCRQGMNQLCSRRRLIGAHRPGAFADYVSAPAWMVLPLPSGLPLRDGALTEPVACAVRIARHAGQVAGETLLILGAGTIGLLALQVLLSHGAKQVFIADTQAERLEVAQAVGGQALDPRQTDVVKTVRAASGGLGAAVSVDAVGKAVTREQCISATRPGGHMILSGLHEETSVIPAADVIRREITLHGSFCYTPDDFQQAARLLAQGQIRLDPWIVEAPLAEGGTWFEQLSSEDPGKIAKVLLVP